MHTRLLTRFTLTLHVRSPYTNWALLPEWRNGSATDL